MTNDVNKLWPMRAIRMAHVHLHTCLLNSLFLSIFCSAFVHVFRREQLIEEMDTHLDGTLTGISHGKQITSNKQSFLLNLVFLSLVLLALLYLLLPRQSLAFGHM